ncbi:MAG: hypothetical protein JNM27_10030 [Leptospirales bacterium]|nr:hypothetical protein [Leptospirales bacterium]
MRLSYVLSAALYFLCIWLNWVDLSSSRAEPNTAVETSGFYHYLNSDALYAPALFRDLFIEKFSTRGWTLPPAPYFFPDLLIYFCVLAFLQQPLAAFVAGIIQFSISLLCAAFFLKTAFPENRYAFPSVALAGSVLQLLIIQDILPASFRGLIIPTFHHGASASAFLAYAFILRALFRYRPRSDLAFLFLLSWLTMLSDSTYAALLVPGSLLFLGLSDVKRSRKVWVLTAIGTGIYLGRSSVRWFNSLGNAQIVTIAPEKDVLAGLTHWSVSHLSDFAEPWHLFAIYVGMICLILGLLFKRRPTRVVLLLPGAAILSILLAANVFGPQVGIAKLQDRYVFFALFASVVLVAFWGSRWFLIRYPGVSLLIVFTFVLILKAGEPREHPLFPNTQCLKQLATDQHLNYGIADYWFARPYTILSNREIRLNEVDLSLGPRPWINNLDRFIDETGAPEYSYLIVNNLPSEAIRQRLGPPGSTHTCGHLQIWVYDKKKNPALTNLFSIAQLRVWRQAIGR